MQSVIPGHGAALGVLARTSEPLTGRRIATLTQPQVSQTRVNHILGELARDGVASVDSRPPGRYYVLTSDHVAAPGILALASMWQTLLDRNQTSLGTWRIPPLAAWLFGSTARADAGINSDVDILIVAADHVADEDAWAEQADSLTDQVRKWSGNACELLALTETEIRDAVQGEDRLIDELRRDAIHLAGAQPSALLSRRAG